MSFVVRVFGFPITRDVGDHVRSRRFLPPTRPFSSFHCKQSTYLIRPMGDPGVTLGWPRRDPGVTLGSPNPNPSPAEGRNPKMQIPSSQAGYLKSKKLWTAGALACEIFQPFKALVRRLGPNQARGPQHARISRDGVEARFWLAWVEKPPPAMPLHWWHRHSCLCAFLRCSCGTAAPGCGLSKRRYQTLQIKDEYTLARLSTPYEKFVIPSWYM